jgi:hypothetical protein
LDLLPNLRENRVIVVVVARRRHGPSLRRAKWRAQAVKSKKETEKKFGEVTGRRLRRRGPPNTRPNRAKFGEQHANLESRRPSADGQKKKKVRQPGIEPGAKQWECLSLPLTHWRWSMGALLNVSIFMDPLSNCTCCEARQIPICQSKPFLKYIRTKYSPIKCFTAPIKCFHKSPFKISNGVHD